MTLELPPESTAPSDTEGETDPSTLSTTRSGQEWWRSAVFYQVYPRSFADDSGDGIGDLAGITRRLPALADLGADAVWLSPFYVSPQRDAGYDVADYCDVDPRFGTLDDFDRLQRTVHELGMRIMVDLVPNHSSSDHPWFQEALASPPGSPERARYIFRDGRGADGSLPPNNWQSVFGGGMWTRITEADGTPGQWYLHIFDASQPDLDWENPWVREQFRGILRFWLDRGADGFRVDVAHGLVKAPGLPDYLPPDNAGSMGGGAFDDAIMDDEPTGPESPYWGQEGVHDIFRDWHAVLAEYEGDRVMVAEAWVEPVTKLADWVRDDEMSQAFNFPYLETPWSANALRRVIDRSLTAFGAVGAPSTWVLSNHDVVRHATRLALTAENPQGQGVGPGSLGQPIPELGLRRARAATLLMLALPGAAYLYQGEELGLPEVVHLPDDTRQDPTWFRSGGKRYGRDGCRVPIPWEADTASYGFSVSGESWLPQPGEWAALARDTQQGVPGSTLELYRLALSLRRGDDLGSGALDWMSGYGEQVVAFRNRRVTVIANIGEVAVELPLGEVLVSSDDLDGASLPADTTVWMVQAPPIE